MRIAMKYGSAPSHCGTFAYGEVEDYSINIGLTTGTALNWKEASDIGRAARSEKNMNPLTPVFNIRDHKTNTLKGSGFSFSPNPNQGHILLQYESVAGGPASVVIYDAHGKPLLKRVFEALSGTNESRMDFDNLSPGTYFIRLLNEGNIQTKKMIVIP